MTYQILTGDAVSMLRTLPDQSVHCCVTSPPYWGLRDYGAAGQIGLESSPAEYVARLCEVFAEVWRVLRDDGSLWLNIGDSYAANRGYQVPDGKFIDVGNSSGARVPAGLKPKDLIGIPWRVAFALQDAGWYLRSEITWCKRAPMPESVQDRPTSATEKIFLLTKRARYFYDAVAVQEEKAESTISDDRTNGNGARRDRLFPGSPSNGGTNLGGSTGGRNLRNFWLLSPDPFSDVIKTVHLSRVEVGVLSGGMTHRVFEDCPLHGSSCRLDSTDKPVSRDCYGASVSSLVDNGCICEFYAKTTKNESHFATFPREIPKRAILAGTSARGCCPTCGAPWRRVAEETNEVDPSAKGSRFDKGKTGVNGAGRVQAGERTVKIAAGWSPSCGCDAGDPVPCTVLDPFLGSGTTVAVATSLGRDGVGIELNPAYVALAHKRIGKAQPALVAVGM